MVTTEEFCGGYKGTHRFEEGENQCRCGRAYLRAPRPMATGALVVCRHCGALTSTSICPSCGGSQRVSVVTDALPCTCFEDAEDPQCVVHNP